MLFSYRRDGDRGGVVEAENDGYAAAKLSLLYNGFATLYMRRKKLFQIFLFSL
jgi:hypothetical protein